MPIQSYRYSIFNIIKSTTILGWRSVCFVRCILSVIISLRAHLLVAVALFMLYFGQNRSSCRWETTTGVFESTNYTHENTVAGHNLLSTHDKFEPNLNPNISAESWRMKMTEQQYFKVTSLRFLFQSQKHFFAYIFTSNCHDDVMITPPQQAYSWIWRWNFKSFWDRQNALKELVMTNHHFAVFILHDLGELRGL